MTGQLDLWTDVRPHDPETSHLAARTTAKAEGRRKVLAFFSEWGNAGHAFTDHQVARATGMVLGSAQKRRKDLEREGLIEFAGVWGVSDSGSPARKWRLVMDKAVAS